jgi:hypothetical protein
MGYRPAELSEREARHAEAEHCAGHRHGAALGSQRHGHLGLAWQETTRRLKKNTRKNQGNGNNNNETNEGTMKRPSRTMKNRSKTDPGGKEKEK